MNQLGNNIRTYICRPALQALGLWSQAAENLVLGTAAHESGGFTYLAQVGGPALGWPQIEPVTYEDLLSNSLPGMTQQIRDALHAAAPSQFSGYLPASELPKHPYYCMMVCRLLYFRAPFSMPSAVEIPRLAAIWKQYYNTPLGAGTAEEWLANYNRYCV